ncbi:hypothetical protein [Pseudaminobacter salicylatoxidans]|uniref:hypothetical protein n=1 Tax=Pseudaminobacter salicylatoxidans TaxID=93369 RepID=UPI0003613DE8|nr:hypothetical protein [Pseudaminobacter salicylatoxidans]
MLAIDAYRQGNLKVVRGLSHYDECTLGLSLQALERMDAEFVEAYVASGLSPMCNSFNACLDFAVDCGADILFHTASDVIVDRMALIRLLETMDLEENYLAIAKGYDPMFGPGASVGIWIWNMRIVGRDYRFRDEFKQDLRLCERIEEGTGKSRVYTPREMQLGYHHPIWTAQDVYRKFAYSYPKYGERRKKDMRDFLTSGLARNVNNKALMAGQRALIRAESAGLPDGSKNVSEIDIAFQSDTADLHLDGSEYYVRHQAFKSYAKRVMNSFVDCVCEDE